MAGHSNSGDGSEGGSPAGRLAREVSELQASLLAKLHRELDPDTPEQFAAAAARLAADFGSVTATAVDAAYEQASAAAGAQGQTTAAEAPVAAEAAKPKPRKERKERKKDGKKEKKTA